MQYNYKQAIHIIHQEVKALHQLKSTAKSIYDVLVQFNKISKLIELFVSYFKKVDNNFNEYQFEQDCSQCPL